MKKAVLIALISMGSFAELSAQDRTQALKIAIATEFLLPVGRFSEINQYGYSAIIQGERVISNYMSINGGTGIRKFEMKENIKQTTSCGCENEWNIPIMIGSKYHFGRFFGGAEAGGTFGVGQQRNIGLIYAPSLGANIPINHRTGIDISARYEGWAYKGSQDSFLGVRVAYVFGL